MRILHILDHSLPLHSGYTFRTLAILREQRARGWETFHITSGKQGGYSVPREEIDHWVFYRTPPASGPGVQLPLVRQMSVVTQLSRRLCDVVEEVRPDILHAHSPALNAVAAFRVAKRFNLPVVYEVRAFWEDAAVDHGTSREWGLRYRLTRALETYALKHAQAVTTICEGLATEILGRGVHPSKVTVIPNAVDVSRFSLSKPPDPKLAASLRLTDKKVLGFVGSFYAYEGLNVLIRAMPEMLRQRPEIRVLLVGGGPEADKLRELTRTLQLTDSVVFAGRVPHEEVNRYYDLIDVLVYPRLPMRLTELVTPLKPLEAMAQGRLVVASDVGGHKELIRNGETGSLFTAGSEGALAEAVLKLLGDEPTQALMRTRGRDYVELERTWAKSVARYAAAYARSLGTTDVQGIAEDAEPPGSV